MGCASSSEAGAAVDPAEAQQSARIDEELRRAKKEQAIISKALLLGPGESGKSTIVKQLKLIYGRPWTEEERRNYREVVFANVVHQTGQAVIAGYPVVGLSLPSSIRDAVTLLHTLEPDEIVDPALDDAMRPQVAEALKELWDMEETKKVVENSAAFQLNDSASYFFDALPRISQPNYIPTVQDVLRTRVKSTGIVEETFDIKELGRKLTVLDVGGQRSERKKWIHCFENVNVLLFVVAISEYPQMLYEDNSVNRLDESVHLWESISASRWFSKTSFVLFLNKIDLFAEKVQSGHYPLSRYCPDYSGRDDDPEAGKRYMRQRFMDVHQGAARPGGPGRAFYAHWTCATDTESTRVVLSAVLTNVLTTRLNDAGLL
ncbi:hypothetical protein JCM8097_006204 [Rhodosporidiobolus ruineniae]